jgi:hypothetical protein
MTETVRVRFGIKGIPVFPNAATFVRTIKTNQLDDAQEAFAMLRVVFPGVRWFLEVTE